MVTKLNPKRRAHQRHAMAAATALGAALFLSGTSDLGAESDSRIAFEPAIRSVTVYSDRALVTRSASLRLKAGKHTLVFDDAHPALDIASLRGFSQDEQVIVQGINTYVERRATTVNKDLRALEQQLDDLERQKESSERARERASIDLRGADQYSAYVARVVSELSTQNRSAENGPSKWEEAMKFLSERRIAARRDVQRAEQKIADINERSQIIRADIDRIRAAAQKSQRIVEVTVQVLRDTEGTIGFSYIVHGASWAVSYGMYLENDGTVTIEYYGNITQKTGEDWKGVTLALSTARPSTGAQRPTIAPLVITARQTKTKDQVVMRERERDEGGGGSGAVGGETGESEPADAYTDVQDTGSSLVFQIRQPADIPSGDRSQRVAIARFQEKPVEISHRIVPPVKHSAHLSVKIQNSRAFPLLGGPVDIYRVSGFTGRSALKYTPAGSPAVIGLGPDSTVRVRRNLTNFRETAGVVSKDKVFRVEVTLDIENQSDQERTVHAFERMPVSEIEEIKVKLLDVTSPGWQEEKSGSGILRWDLRLKPRETKRIVMSYAVQVPGKMNVDIQPQ